MKDLLDRVLEAESQQEAVRRFEKEGDEMYLNRQGLPNAIRRVVSPERYPRVCRATLRKLPRQMGSSLRTGGFSQRMCLRKAYQSQPPAEPHPPRGDGGRT